MTAALALDVPKPLRLSLVGFLGVTALQLWLIFTHAPWFDEAQALLIARAPLPEMFEALHYEGHPALWYLYLAAVDSVVRSPLSLPVAQAFVSVATAALIWFRAPFPLPTKALLALSYFILFEYGVISRSYGLGALLLLVAAEGRFRWLALALAVNISAHFAVAASALAAVWFIERPNWRGAALVGLGLVASAATVLPKPDDAMLAVPMTMPLLMRLLLSVMRLSGVVAPALPADPYQWGVGLRAIPALFVGLGVWLAPMFLLKGWWTRLAWLGLCLAFVMMGAFVYYIYPRHVGALFVVLVALHWSQGRAPIWFTAWLGGLAILGAIAAAAALQSPFTRAPEVAQWFRSRGLENEPIGAWPAAAGTPTGLLLGRPIINPHKGCSETYIRWDYDQTDVRGASAAIEASGARFIIAERPAPKSTFVASFPPGLYPRGVAIYEFTPTRPPPPPCKR